MSNDAKFHANPNAELIEWNASIRSNDGPEVDLAVVILNYNTRDLLTACLDSVLASRGPFRYTVCVVDNGSTDESVEAVRTGFPRVGLIVNKDNVGFSAGNNQALRALGYDGPSGEGGSLPRYALLLNPDTLLPDGALTSMLDFMDQRPQAGVGGPRVRRPDGSLDLACRRTFPSPQVSFFRLSGLSRLFPQSPIFNAYNLNFLPEDSVHEVDSVVGAFMMVRREAIQRVGLLDEAYFMYGEDLDWAKRIKDVGWQVWYNGEVEITHVKEAASKRSRRARLAFYEAMWIFYQKHYRAQTPWLLDKMIVGGIATLGGADMANRLWRTSVASGNAG